MSYTVLNFLHYTAWYTGSLSTYCAQIGQVSLSSGRGEIVLGKERQASSPILGQMGENLRKICTYMLDLYGSFYYCWWSSLKSWFIIKFLIFFGERLVRSLFYSKLFFVCLFLHRNKIYYGLEGRGKFTTLSLLFMIFHLQFIHFCLRLACESNTVDYFPQPSKHEVSYLRTSLIYVINQVWISAWFLCYNYVMGGDLLVLVF